MGFASWGRQGPLSFARNSLRSCALRISGSAGTGKTIVALHRAAHLARTHPNARVLLTTFSDTLASALQTKLRRLLGSEPVSRGRVEARFRIRRRAYPAHQSAANKCLRALN